MKANQQSTKAYTAGVATREAARNAAATTAAAVVRSFKFTFGNARDFVRGVVKG